MKPHRFDPISFIAGIFIVSFGLLFLLPAELGDLLDFAGGIDEIASWFWPIVFLAIGTVILVPVLFRKNGQPADEAEDVDSTL